MKRGEIVRRSLWSLPDDCILHILSRTTPRDVCRLSATSSAFNTAAQSDVVWSALLPSDVDGIIAAAAYQLPSLSRRDLFFCLSGSPLLLANSLIFSLDKESGKKCYTIPSTMLSNSNGKTPIDWKWTPSCKFRTNSVLKFSRGSRLSLIQGKVNVRLLSPSTSYSAYLIFKLQDRSVDNYPVSFSVNYDKTGKNETRLNKSKAYLTTEIPLVVPIPNCRKFPQLREDGWMEVVMGEFYNDGFDEDDDVELVLKSSKTLVSTLLMGGIELRPTESNGNDTI